MKKLIPALSLLLFVSCASNPHWEKTQTNQDNEWKEKQETYRALSSVKEREKDTK